MTVAEVTFVGMRVAAMNLLAVREHSKEELRKKLAQKFGVSDLIEPVLEQLREDGLQSDSRFTDAFINMRKRQGKGPIVILKELNDRGISAELRNEYISKSQRDWNNLALKVKQKKYGDEQIFDLKTKLKQMRFLASRGFDAASVKFAIECGNVE